MTSNAIWGTYGYHPWWYSARLRKSPWLVPRANETSGWDSPFPALTLATTTSSRLMLSPQQTESALTAHLKDCEQQAMAKAFSEGLYNEKKVPKKRNVFD